MRFSSPVQDLGASLSHEPVYSKIAESPAPEQSSATKSGKLANIPADCDTSLSQLLSRPKATGGYSALRCEPLQWSCCSPKREQDLRPGESMACHWMCVPIARACTGFRGPRFNP